MKRPVDRIAMLCLVAAAVIGCGIVFAGKGGLAAWLGLAACGSVAWQRMRSADR